MAFDFPSVATEKRKAKEKKKIKQNKENQKYADKVDKQIKDIGEKFDKKFKKYATSKESQLHAKDYDDGIDKGEMRALNEAAQESGIPLFREEKSKGGRMGYKDGSKGCKMATKGKGRAYGKNS